MGLRVGNFRYRDTKIELGQLAGNHFMVTLRRVTASAEQVSKAVETLRESGFVRAPPAAWAVQD